MKRQTWGSFSIFEVSSGTEEDVLTHAGDLPGVSPGSFQVSHRTQTYRAVLVETRDTDSLLQDVLFQNLNH